MDELCCKIKNAIIFVDESFVFPIMMYGTKEVQCSMKHCRNETIHEKGKDVYKRVNRLKRQ